MTGRLRMTLAGMAASAAILTAAGCNDADESGELRAELTLERALAKLPGVVSADALRQTVDDGLDSPTQKRWKVDVTLEQDASRRQLSKVIWAVLNYQNTNDGGETSYLDVQREGSESVHRVTGGYGTDLRRVEASQLARVFVRAERVLGARPWTLGSAGVGVELKGGAEDLPDLAEICPLVSADDLLRKQRIDLYSPRDYTDRTPGESRGWVRAVPATLSDACQAFRDLVPTTTSLKSAGKLYELEVEASIGGKPIAVTTNFGLNDVPNRKQLTPERYGSTLGPMLRSQFEVLQQLPGKSTLTVAQVVDDQVPDVVLEVRGDQTRGNDVRGWEEFTLQR